MPRSRPAMIPPRPPRGGRSSVSAEVVTAVEVEEITTMDAPGWLRDECSALWSRCPGATPFQAPEWLILWRRAFGEGDPWTLALRHEGRLVGLVPLFLPAY